MKTAQEMEFRFTANAKRLEKLLGKDITSVNNGRVFYRRFKTPKARILAALDEIIAKEKAQ